ncbi:hypothetical protein D3C73_853790 [compost metagenome]
MIFNLILQPFQFGRVFLSIIFIDIIAMLIEDINVISVLPINHIDLLNVAKQPLWFNINNHSTIRFFSVHGSLIHKIGKKTFTFVITINDFVNISENGF